LVPAQRFAYVKGLEVEYKAADEKQKEARGVGMII
jgi:hypothetical protein